QSKSWKEESVSDELIRYDAISTVIRRVIQRYEGNEEVRKREQKKKREVQATRNVTIYSKRY
ncbi:hypothetical protein V6M84_12775, partial [Enterococcus faecalis]|uniref:hypothetical protein n=1 Tax=Enterococcus faecalis TaxID=1351 RepID=UPI002FEE8089